jgi:lipoprotein-releasing system permease protein
MYKFLLCWRYLLTRYIALVCIVSIMLGVGTMIVVNSVMDGFTCEMQNRIHGILSDVVVEARDFSGMPDAEGQMELIRKTVGNDIEAMSPTVFAPALVVFQYQGQTITRQAQLIGIDPKTQGKVSDLSKYLQHANHRKNVESCFNLEDGGYDARDLQSGTDAVPRPQMADAGWPRRREIAQITKLQEEYRKTHPNGESEIQQRSYEEENADPTIPPPAMNVPAADPFGGKSVVRADVVSEFDMATQQNTGMIMGISMSCIRMLKDKNDSNGGCQDHFLTRPGEDIRITCPTVGIPPKEVSGTFTLVDFYESKMNEYDTTFVFVPIDKLQEMRGMDAKASGVSKINSIQIKLKPGAKGDEVRDKLQKVFPKEFFEVETWRDKQGALLAAVQMETMILNILLFMIIAVAGFGILAIFYMIVVEKTRDIGILKSLGASNNGVMGIFLSYGFLLGIVGSGFGMAGGLLFVRNINRIADFLAWIRGMPVFDPTIYYFNKIPTNTSPLTVTLIVLGALGIAVGASILPACRAARLHPVEALRYE